MNRDKFHIYVADGPDSETYEVLLARVIKCARDERFNPVIIQYSLRAGGNVEGAPILHNSEGAVLHNVGGDSKDRRDIYRFIRWDSDLVTQLNVTFPEDKK
jgi:hypothetical protein